MSRRLLLFSVPLLALALLAAAAPGRRRGPNLIFIAVDNLRADRLSCAGYARPVSPNLDKLAAASAYYPGAVSPASWTLPAFASVFTSVYPSEHGLVNKSRLSASMTRLLPASLPWRLKTLPEFLRDSGYRTAAFTGGAALSREFGFARGFELFSQAPDFGPLSEAFAGARRWLASAGAEPFFLFLHGYDLHAKARRPPSFSNYSRKTGAGLKAAMAAREKARAESDRGGSLPAPRALAALSDLYDDQLLSADAEIGAFLAYLEERGLLENSVLVLFSDHGEEFGEHGTVGHGRNLYEESVRVPLFIRVPGAPARREEGQVSLVDLFPTAAALLGLDLPAGLRGQVRGRDIYTSGTAGCRTLFSETEYLLYVNKAAARSCGGQKLIKDELNAAGEVYDLAADPAERRNLYGSGVPFEYELEAALLERAQ